MHATLTHDGTASPATEEDIRRAHDGHDFFWLDLDTSDGTGTEVLTSIFGFHPLAVEDAEHFGQRPKLEDYDDFSYMVIFGVSDAGVGPTETTLVELHLFVSDRFLVTVHHDQCTPLNDVRARMSRHRATGGKGASQVVLTYMIVDALTDSYFPVLSRFDDQVDDLESAILANPTEEQLGVLFAMKRSLVTMRRVIAPERDMFAGLSSGVLDLPGMTDESGHYFRDLYDHLIRISDMVDSYRDLLSGVMDTHLSTVSNRLNVVMKQLAIIATVFLPLSFLTGFFGQNFAAMVNHITGWPAFLGLGIGTEVVAAVLLMVLFKRRGWLGGPAA